jgi:hypothetical protein
MSRKGQAKNYDLETDNSLGPLPNGWEKAVTADGRSYFVE